MHYVLLFSYIFQTCQKCTYNSLLIKTDSIACGAVLLQRIHCIFCQAAALEWHHYSVCGCEFPSKGCLLRIRDGVQLSEIRSHNICGYFWETFYRDLQRTWSLMQLNLLYIKHRLVQPSIPLKVEELSVPNTCITSHLNYKMMGKWWLELFYFLYTFIVI